MYITDPAYQLQMAKAHRAGQIEAAESHRYNRQFRSERPKRSAIIATVAGAADSVAHAAVAAFAFSRHPVITYRNAILR